MIPVKVAKTTAAISWDGRRIVIKQHVTTADPEHPIVHEHPELWTDLVVTFPVEHAPEPPKTPEPSRPESPAAGAETATAGPGERRTVSTPPTARKTRRGPRSASQEGTDK